jgi:hypothetical protein
MYVQKETVGEAGWNTVDPTWISHKRTHAGSLLTQGLDNRFQTEAPPKPSHFN